VVLTISDPARALTDLMTGQIQLLAGPMLSLLPLAQGSNSTQRKSRRRNWVRRAGRWLN